MGGLIDITLREPAKIDGKRREAGETVSVSAEVAAQLGHAVEADEGTVAVQVGDHFEAFALKPDWEAAAAARTAALDRVAVVEAELAQQRDVAAKAIALQDEALAAADKAAALMSQMDDDRLAVIAERDRLAARVRELEAQIAAAVPPMEPAAAETTSPPKRGSKAAKG